MFDRFWILIAQPYVMGVLMSWLAEMLLRPRPVAVWRRPASSAGVHLGVWTLAFTLELMLFRRPYFAVANVLAIQMVIILVSNAKHRALREPFVYPDFEYFIDAIRHPRLYLPFLGIGPLFAAIAGYGLVLWAGLALEPSLTALPDTLAESAAGAGKDGASALVVPPMLFWLNALSLAVIGLAVCFLCGARLAPGFHAAPDLKHLGLLAALWAYGRAERQAIGEVLETAPFANRPLPGNTTDPRALPDLVVIQSESFFDARRAYPVLRPSVLENFDRIKAEGALHGTLATAAWGANTVRSEFSFLSGMAGSALGVHQYNPYRRLAASGFPTLASYAKSMGYRTICVHPYHREFYRRDSVLPKLGFDEFVSIDDFKDAERVGPYISDKSAGEMAVRILNARVDAPTYVHIITMENHGPLHLEKTTADDMKEFMRADIKPGCEDLVAYARHLRNADIMLGNMQRELSSRPWPAALCFYGDHVPIMPGVYDTMGEPDGLTEYLIWGGGRKNPVHPQPMSISELAELYLFDTFGVLAEKSF